MIVKQGKVSHYVDGYLYRNLIFAKGLLRKDWDFCILIDGIEGSGKSIFGQLVAWVLDSTICLDRIVFTPKEFKEAVIKAEKFEAIIYDEAFGGLASRASLSEVNLSLVQMLAQVRQKNLCLIIIMPCLWELDRYAAVWRSRMLLHCYTGKKWERGYFGFYSYEKKKELYFMGKKSFRYSVRPDFRGRFTGGYLVPEDAYRAKKFGALAGAEKGRFTRTDMRYDRHRSALVRFLKSEGYTEPEIAQAMGGTRAVINLILRKSRIEKEKAAQLLS